MTKGHCILSHGFESGPDATKVTALADVAERLGWTHERPDYTGFDARRETSELGDVEARQAHLLALATSAAKRGPLVLAGSSLGSYISARVSLQVPIAGLFLMAPPTTMGRLADLEAARVPTSIIHGWDDELIPAHGIYATIVVQGEQSHRAVTSIGVRPTIGDNVFTIETFILDGSYDLYGVPLRLAFVKWLRPEVRFDSIEDLKVQMARDCADAAALFDQMAI